MILIKWSNNNIRLLYKLRKKDSSEAGLLS